MAKLESSFIHQEIEPKIYQKWLQSNVFVAGSSKKVPFSMVLPPPNVTGKLHIGHAMNSSLQDLIARFKRMQGFDVLFLPGSDHAGIATQVKVEERLRLENLTRYDLGREKFVDTIWKWKEEYLNIIHQQFATLGLSLDYTKERFTLDEVSQKAILETFTKMYNQGLIYRGEKIINYDPYLKTALSNIEIIYKETESKLYYFKYYIKKSQEYLTVATTRPETMFGDEAVVVNPNDERYAKYKGKKVINPANGKLIPIIFDEYVDINFGTGVMKCTPAHDFNDFTLGQKYKLNNTVIMNLDATMNKLTGEFEGLDRYDCRQKLVDKLEKEEKLVKIEKYLNQVGYSERSNVVVEPTLSVQWFVKMEAFAKKAIELQESDQKIEFYPKRFEKVFLNWIEKIEDWCISRQIWWGYQIPAYYHKETKEIVVGKPPKDIHNYVQDPDVLDTWFSSVLWPYSTLGWPESTTMFKRYYPNNVLVTAYDIIFFWVSRMIFKGLFDTGQKPFKEVLIHGLIRDSKGLKMSKSLNNGVDPMEIIKEYGADSLRFFLLTNSTPGLDLRYSDEKLKNARSFVNKIWNAARFIDINLPENYQYQDFDYDELGPIDRWILKKLDKTVEIVTNNLEKYETGIAGNNLYNFVYDDFCSWYIELGKNSDNNPNVTYYVLMTILKLLHPIMPFVTEYIYNRLNNSGGVLSVQKWPQTVAIYQQFDDSEVNLLLKVITAVRVARNDNKIPATEKLGFYFENPYKYNIQQFQSVLFKMLSASNINFVFKNQNGISIFVDDLKITIVRKIDSQQELKRLEKELEIVNGEVDRSNSILTNDNFLKKASSQKIELEKNKYQNYLQKKQNIIEQIEKLK